VTERLVVSIALMQDDVNVVRLGIGHVALVVAVEHVQRCLVSRTIAGRLDSDRLANGLCGSRTGIHEAKTFSIDVQDVARPVRVSIKERLPHGVLPLRVPPALYFNQLWVPEGTRHYLFHLWVEEPVDGLRNTNRFQLCVHWRQSG